MIWKQSYYIIKMVIIQNCYTFHRRPVEIVYYTEFDDVNQAIAFEKQVKGWSRAKKEAIINDEWEKLPNLSKRKFPNR